MKKILINAMTIKEGGGAVVFYKTFNEVIKQDTTDQYYLIIDEVLRSKLKITNKAKILVFPWVKKSSMHLLFWNEFVLPRLVKKLKIDCVYSQINTLPFRKLSCKEWLSVIHAGYFSNEFIMLNNKYNNTWRQKIGWFIRKHWVSYSIKKADKVTVPTKALNDAIIHKLKIKPNKISVIWPGSGLAEGDSLEKISVEKKKWKIGYITKYGVQKNFDVLFEAAAKLKSCGVDFKLILTLNENHPPFQNIRALIQKYNISDVIENNGESSESKLCDLYLTLDLFIFPSLCESIGFTLLEAMYYAVPIIAADVASHRELLGESGMYFAPHNAEVLCEQIITLLQDADLYKKQSQYSLNRSHLFSWEESARHTLRVLHA